ncbi:dihydroorotate dehydrogenase electron transfer subunit [Candidatus Sumerlaeota bacterium]|nr:dihydroorotate dehydrogenase electron transfer subunit [Candidatus Sumerlaeota bacterium]
MKQQLFAPIVEIDRFADGLYRFALNAPFVAQHCAPGQFVNVKVAHENYPLLRRPLSIHDSDGIRRIDLVFRVVGEGTAILAERRVGDELDLIGPLGSPFRIIKDKRALLAGGGVGIPPIHFLFREIQRRELPHFVICGMRNKDEAALAGAIPYETEHYELCTDDGSLGRKGLAIDPLIEQLNAVDPASVAVYCCGPEPMLRAVIRLCNERGVECQVSFEQQMACGFGACIGCSIETKKGYQRVCTEGPVFSASDFE